MTQSDFPVQLSAPARRRSFDRFELRRELGSGVTGVVWQAWDRQRTSDVALKILHRFDAALMRRFKQEFRTLADVRHRNIVRIHELFELDERLFFSMELIDGVDVLSWIWGYHPAAAAAPADEEHTEPFEEEITKPHALVMTGPKVDYARLRASFAQLVRGLGHLHAAGYLHRDLKASNLMVRRDGHLSILDFGLAVSLLAPTGGELEAAGGTIAYLAPEIAAGRKPDARADHYSLGVLLYEALTGRTPFPGEAIAEVMAAKVHRDPSPPSSLVPGVPADLDELCCALLRRDPEQRAGAALLLRAFRDPSSPHGSLPPPSNGAPLPIGAPAISSLTTSWDGFAPVATADLTQHIEVGRALDERLARGSGPIPRPPVVGRGREVAALCSALARARIAGAQLRLVLGPSGIGKSAFADELARLLAAGAGTGEGGDLAEELGEPRAPALVLRGRCHDRETIAFRAIDQIIDALAHHLAALPAGERAQLAPPRLHLAAELFPVLRGLFAARPEPRPRDPGILRARAFAALRELLALVARRAPLALVIDDLHLADPDSLDLLTQLFLGAEAPPLLLVGLGRPGAVMDRLAALAGGGVELGRLELGPLEGEEAELVARALAHYMEIELPDASSLAIDTRGHPGFTFEILSRAAAAIEIVEEPRGRRERHEPSHVGPLPALQSVLAMRIAGLSEPARRLLELLCAVGGPCSVQLAADVLELSGGQLAAALDDLVDADLVVATGRTEDDAFELYHERIGDAVAAAGRTDSFTAIHRALAEGLEQRGDFSDPGDSHPRLLRHWQGSGDPVRAAHYRSLLANQAVGALELARAAHYHETSLAETLPPAIERRVRRELAAVYDFQGRQQDSAAQHLAAARLATAAGDLDDALELRCRAAASLLSAAEVEEGRALIEQVLAELGLSAPAPSSRAEKLWSALCSRIRRFADDTFTSRPEGSVPRRQSVMLDALAVASSSVGALQPMRGRAYQQRYLEVARQVGDRVRYTRAVLAEAAWLSRAGAHRRAQVEDLLSLAEELTEMTAASAGGKASARATGERALVDALCELHLGDFAAARLAIERALPALESERLGACSELRDARTYAAWIFWLTGDFAELRRRVPAWARQARDLGDRFTRTSLTTGPAIGAWLYAGEVETAERQLEEAERIWAGLDAPMPRWQLAVARVELELFRGEPRRALAALEPELAAARRAGLTEVEALRGAMLHLEQRALLALVAELLAHPSTAGSAASGSGGETTSLPCPTVCMRRIDQLGQALAKEAAPWAQALGELTAATSGERAGLAGAAVPATASAKSYRAAARALAEAGLGGYAAAAAWRAAVLEGATAAERALTEAAAAAGVADPGRFFAHLLGS
jgi:eukaryotic-like serine/threonine-protein kinase